MDLIKKINNSASIWETLPELSVKDIETIIRITRDSYYNSAVSLITDEVYDVLMDLLKTRSPKSKLLNKVGAPVKKKVKLPYYMGSMHKKKDDHKIDQWRNKYYGPYVVSDKLDGVSCLLVYDQEITLYTRGDGNYGQDISHLLKLIHFPYQKVLSIKERVAIRGELIMTRANFKKYASVNANARNLVAGIVNSKPISVNATQAYDVDFICYEIITPVYQPSFQLEQLIKWGIPCVAHELYDDINLEMLDELLRIRKTKSKYEIDGLIITNDDVHKRAITGNPEYSFAYKGTTITANVTVVAINWTPSKDGVLIPVIHFDKVHLSGVYIENTTGFNAAFIRDNKLGPGAVITIVRSNDTIPHILAIIKPAKTASFPDVEYVWDEKGVNIYLVDIDDNQTVIVKRLTKFVKVIGVENMSEGIMTKLVAAGYDTITKIVTLSIDDLLEIEGFKDTLATKVYINLNKGLNDVDVLKLMVASNIFGRGFGIRKLKKILDVYPDIVDEFKKSSKRVWMGKLLNVEGFDVITVDQFLAALPEFQSFYRSYVKLRKVKPYRNVVTMTGKFKDMIVVFSGFRNAEWEKYIEENGGKVGSSVSSKTTLVVYNDATTAKYLKAVTLGIETMTVDEFSKKYKLMN